MNLNKNTSWNETHFEVVQFITSHLLNFKNNSNDVIFITQENEGHAGLYSLAYTWTNEFENLNKGRQWDGEFFDEIETFCNTKLI